MEEASSQAKNRNERRLITVLLVATTVMFAILLAPLWSGQVPVENDLGSFTLPLRVYYSRCLAEGDSSDWMPQLFGGFSLCGDGQIGTYHPLWQLLYRSIPVQQAFVVESFLAFPAMFLGIVIFLRRYVGLAGACMGAFLFTFSIQSLHFVINPPMPAILAHLPWILMGVRMVAEHEDFRRRCLGCVAIAVLTASQLMMGHPPTTWLSMFTEAIFALFLLRHHRSSRGAWLALSGSMLLALGIAAVQLFPTFASWKSSGRAELYLEFKRMCSVQPSWVVGLIAPYLSFGGVKGWSGIYLHTVPIMLGLWWITAHRINALQQPAEVPGADRDKSVIDWKTARRLSYCGAVLAGLSFWLALGSCGKLYYLQTQLPVIGGFRAPARYLMITHFGVIVVAAVAFARLASFVRSGQRPARCHLIIPWAVVAITTLMSVWFATYGPGAASERFQANLYVGPLFMGTAALAITAACRGRELGLYLLVSLAIVDAALHGMAESSVKAYWHRPVKFEEYIENCPRPPTETTGRLFDTCSWGNTLLLRNYRLTNGYTSMVPVRQLDYDNINSLRVAEVAWYRNWEIGGTPKSLAGLPLSPDGWCRVPDPLPRARFVSETIVSANPREDINSIDIATTALTTHPLDLVKSPPGNVELTLDRPGRLSLETRAKGRQLIVISESYHEGWQAYVDNKPVSVERANGDFFGCVVPEGNHHLRFEFAPKSLFYGKMISCASILFAGLLAGFALFRTSPKSSGDKSADWNAAAIGMTALCATSSEEPTA